MATPKLVGGKEGAKEKDKTPVNELKGREPLAEIYAEDDKRRKSAAETLAKIGDAIGARKSDINFSALIKTLKEDGRDVTPDLIELLKNKKPDVRLIAVELLGKIGDQRAVPALIATLKNDDDGIMRDAIRSALREINTVRSLIKSLKHANMYVRANAVEALGWIGDLRALPALQEVMKNCSEESVRVATKDAIKRIHSLE